MCRTNLALLPSSPHPLCSLCAFCARFLSVFLRVLSCFCFTCLVPGLLCLCVRVLVRASAWLGLLSPRPFGLRHLDQALPARLGGVPRLRAWGGASRGPRAVFHFSDFLSPWWFCVFAVLLCCPRAFRMFPLFCCDVLVFSVCLSSWCFCVSIVLLCCPCVFCVFPLFYCAVLVLSACLSSCRCLPETPCSFLGLLTLLEAF